MIRLVLIALFAVVACGGAQSSQPGPLQAEEVDVEDTAGGAETSAAPEAVAEDEPEAASENEFKLRDSDSGSRGRGVKPSQIKATHTEAAIRFIVVDKDRGPIEGVVISLTSPDGAKYYTEETDAEGFAEVLVPAGKKYDLVYLSLAGRDIAATVPVSDEPKQNIKLTLRYKGYVPPENAKPFVLKGVHFDTNKATIRKESFARLDSIVEYMTHKKSARIEISGHTDNVGKPKRNKVLSRKRAQAVRDYLVSKGVDGSRIEAVGYGDTRPIASNDSEVGRQQNRRIEAIEL